MRRPTSVRRRARLVALGILAVVLAERAAAARASELRAAGCIGPVRRSVVVRAPLDAVWAELADLPGQVRWMSELKVVRIDTPGPIRVGTRATGHVRILGIPVWDRIEVVEWRPPTSFAIRHVGVFAGTGAFVLEDADGSTRVCWEEDLRPPVVPVLWQLLARPVLGRIFGADLDAFARLVEARTP